MNTRLRQVTRMMVIAGLCAAAGGAFAQAPGGGPGYYGPGMMGGPYYGPGPGYGPMGPGHGPHMGPGYGGPMGPGYGPHMGPGFGPGGPGGPGMMHGPGFGGGAGLGHVERMARVLGLSEEQRAKIARIMEDTRSKNWNVIGQIRAERFKLRELMRGDSVNADAAVEQKKKIDELRTQVMRARVEARNQVMALLTPEQREKAKTLRERFGGRRFG